MEKTKVALFCERLSRNDNYRVGAAPPKIKRASMAVKGPASGRVDIFQISSNPWAHQKI
ncbi:MAG: hypothetical protein K2P26_06495 [Oscillospiraceae bacterium]|nr:hypothetical protein [Oscillospiraceae bacterium]